MIFALFYAFKNKCYKMKKSRFSCKEFFKRSINKQDKIFVAFFYLFVPFLLSLLLFDYLISSKNGLDFFLKLSLSIFLREKLLVFFHNYVVKGCIGWYSGAILLSLSASAVLAQGRKSSSFKRGEY